MQPHPLERYNASVSGHREGHVRKELFGITGTAGARVGWSPSAKPVLTVRANIVAHVTP